jgi:hypothetical protein
MIFNQKRHMKSLSKTVTKCMGRLRDAKFISDPTLFWNAEDIGTGCHADCIIARVLDFGDEMDVKRLKEIYSDDEIINPIRTRRGLLPITKWVGLCI